MEFYETIVKDQPEDYDTRKQVPSPFGFFIPAPSRGVKRVRSERVPRFFELLASEIDQAFCLKLLVLLLE